MFFHKGVQITSLKIEVNLILATLGIIFNHALKVPSFFFRFDFLNKNLHILVPIKLPF